MKMRLHNSKIKKIVNVSIFLALVFWMACGNQTSILAQGVLSAPRATAKDSVAVSDIQGNWAAAQISDWLNKGLSQGYPDNTFKPDKNVTRAEFITMANGACGFNAAVQVKYSDVSANDWFAAEISKACAAGYISGYPDGTIRPNALISRQEAACILSKIAKLQTTADYSAINKFKDAGNIAAWSKGAISAVVNKNLMHGYPDQTFQATKSLTRAEAVVILNSLDVPASANTRVKSGKVYDKAGVYGSAGTVETIEGDVTISVSGVTLQNMKITGNLLLAEGIGNGDVTLKKVTVQGTSTVKGGGDHSVVLEDCILPSITVSKEGVRVVASGSTSVSLVQLSSGATLVELNSNAAGFEKVTVSETIPAGAKITLNGSFANVNVDAAKVNVSVNGGTVAVMEVSARAAGASINVDSSAKVTTLTLDAAVSVTGKGTINTAKVSVPGSSFEQTPTSLQNPNNVTVTTGANTCTGGAGSGNGTGGGGGVAPLNLVSSDPVNGSTGVSATPTIKLKFDRGVVREYWTNNQNCFTMADSTGQPVAITVFRASNYLEDSEKENIYITPNSSLTAGKNYTITISAALRANNGKTLGTAKTITFTVAGGNSGGGPAAPAKGTLTISDGDGRSALNAKATNGPADGAQTNRNVMSFKLTADTVEDILIPTGNSINITMSNISGLTKNDLSNIELFTDPNGDGSTNDGASIAAGTMGDITGGTSVVSFTVYSQQTVAASVYMNYIVQLDTSANWGDGDTFTFAANSINITAIGVTSQQAVTVTGAITQRAFVNPAPSVVAPTFVSAEVLTGKTAGDISVTFSSNMESTLDGKSGQFTVMVDGVQDIVTGLQLTSNPTKIKLLLTTKVTTGQVVTVSYNKPNDASKQVKSDGGVALETFTAQTVTNNL